ncbi:MAG: hydantoinase/oxoprolinase family protein, partial [Anaerolineae bacterium]|nr:hydantoinase/oxoprolinase family protein [Anaerolineae bacterium]
DALRSAVLERRDRVDAFAVSSYFGVRNPAHELRARDIIQELTASRQAQTGISFPITCGHELTTRLNAVRRATTAALNARLIPMLRDLIATIRHILDQTDIAAPLMIVKGDGSLVRADWAMRRPIETILSGPAASIVGAWHLAGQRDVWVVDVGGTTTDIAVLREGRPRLNAEGAQVGGWRTMIEAADVHTVGLGGDSHVRLDGNRFPGANRLTIGPRRVVPLCLLASQYPQVESELDRQVRQRTSQEPAGSFVLAQRPATTGLSDQERALLHSLGDTPRSVASLVREMGYGYLVLQQIAHLEAQRLLIRSCFTPTDALHVLGQFQQWNANASRLGATLLAAQVGLTPEAFCEQVVAEMSNRVTTELVTKVLNDESMLPNWPQEPSAAALLARAMGSISNSDLDCRLALRHPLVAVGAPVQAYLPRTAQQLRTGLIVPQHADVANAIGAVVGSVVQRQRVLIRPIEFGDIFRVHLPDDVRDFGTLQDAVDYTNRTVPEQLVAMAHRAGAEQVEINMERVDRTTPLKEGWGQEIYVETELLFTAVGRPSLLKTL